MRTPNPTLEELLNGRGARTYLELARATQENFYPQSLRRGWVTALGLVFSVAVTALPVAGALRLEVPQVVTMLAGPLYFFLAVFGFNAAVERLDITRLKRWERSIETLAERLESFDERHGPFPKSRPDAKHSAGRSA